MMFELSEEQIKNAENFIEECYEKEILLQKKDKKFSKTFEKSIGIDSMPYHGAIGGALSYVFTPTSIGIIIRVKYDGTHLHEEKDLTDYEMF